MPAEVLIELKRFAALGVLEDSDVRRILDNFVSSLPGHVLLLESIRDKGSRKELAAALHKLKGAASSCGFVGVAQSATVWHDAPEPFQAGFHADLVEVIHATIREWHSMTAEFKAR